MGANKFRKMHVNILTLQKPESVSVNYVRYDQKNGKSSNLLS